MREKTETEIILIADPRILNIPIRENHEPMINLKEQTEIIFGASPEIPDNEDYTYLRKTVYEKLKQAQDLLPSGLRFCVYEGFRSLSLQKVLFDNRYLILKDLYPTLPENQLFDETIKMVSPVINKNGSKNIPPHSTGGAVDLYLIDQYADAVEMGIHPQDWADDTKGVFSLTDSKMISGQARQYRRIMEKALKAVGFVNYCTEYWHWSYGDRYWAYHTGQSQAIYGTGSVP